MNIRCQDVFSESALCTVGTHISLFQIHRARILETQLSALDEHLTVSAKIHMQLYHVNPFTLLLSSNIRVQR